MKLLFLYGPTASGKLTIASELATLTGFALFHNFCTISALEPVVEAAPEFRESGAGVASADVGRGRRISYRPWADERATETLTIVNVLIMFLPTLRPEVSRLFFQFPEAGSNNLANAWPADFRALVTAALLTGCRYGELAAMIVNDFNPDAGTLWVKASKDGKPRHVVLTQEGCEFVTDLTVGKPRDARLLLRSNERVWGKSEQRPLAAACAAARIDPPTNFHRLRHTYASRLAMKGVPLAVIAAQLGHSDTRMVEKHYGHLAPSYVAETVRMPLAALASLSHQTSCRSLARIDDTGCIGLLEESLDVPCVHARAVHTRPRGCLRSAKTTKEGEAP